MSKYKKIVGKMLKSIEAGKQLDADIKNSIKKTGILFVVTVVFIGVGLFFGKRFPISIATVNTPLWLIGGFLGLICGCSVFVWFRTLASICFLAWCFWIGSVLIAVMGFPYYLIAFLSFPLSLTKEHIYIIAYLLYFGCIAFLPFIVAFKIEHKNIKIIGFLNLLLGTGWLNAICSDILKTGKVNINVLDLTPVCWAMLLTWALWPRRKKHRPPIRSKPKYPRSKIAS